MPSESEMRLHRCCFTGHRPEKLHRSEKAIRADLEQAIRKAISDGFTVFITGMARGVDLVAGEIVLQLRTEGFPIRLICASPYPGFEHSWSNEWQRRYNSVLSNADLVNHSARVIAVFNGQPSGTKNTIDYAHRQGIPVIQIEG